jgi:mono/diheme cytochrome c family protein
MPTLRYLRVPLALALASLLSSACGRGAAAGSETDPVARGRYLVQTMGCADCHSPRGPDGQPIAGRDLSGHPADAPLPSWDPSLLERNGVATIAPTGTAFAGPFGVSVAGNLTPDAETGIGRLSAEALIRSWKTGTHWAVDRPVLPPMPLEAYRHLEEADIRAIHAYLHALPAQRNPVPASVPAPLSGG